MMKKVLLGFLLLISVTFLFVNIKNYKTEIVDSEDLAVYVNDELVSSIPKKGEAMFIKSVCDNDAKASWDNDNWGLLVTNMSKKTRCNLYFYQGDTVFNFDYTGGEQVFTVPVSGTYKLETWGAKGGDTSREKVHLGGYGGYSNGKIILNVNEKLYINVGGAGEAMSGGLYSGGYNGGGGRIHDRYDAYVTTGSGGGATHIALKSGLLSTLEKYKDDILIVSGGGGGAKVYDTSDENYSGDGGSGGGFLGVSGKPASSIVYGYGTGGSQTSGGGVVVIESANGSAIGSFGQGAVVDQFWETYYLLGSGGGGGYYGGGSIEHGPAGGGSGYIGNPLLKDKAMYCYNCEESSEESTKTISTTCSEETPTENCAKKGNGYARITLVSIDE